MIKDLLHATERERKARLISVIGIGGIGKSRLAWEFVKYIDGLSEDVFWHHGGAPLTETASRSGRSARWCGCAPGSPKPTTERSLDASSSATVGEYVVDDGGASLDRAPIGASAGTGGRLGRRAR